MSIPIKRWFDSKFTRWYLGNNRRKDATYAQKSLFLLWLEKRIKVLKKSIQQVLKFLKVKVLKFVKIQKHKTRVH